MDQLWCEWKSLSCVQLFGILQVRILEWVAFSLLHGSSQSRDQAQVSHIAGRFFVNWAIEEAPKYWSG